MSELNHSANPTIGSTGEIDRSGEAQDTVASRREARWLAARSEEPTATNRGRRDEPNGSHLGLGDCALNVGSLRWRRRLPGAARSLNARLQVCDLRLVVTVGVHFWFLLNVGLPSRFTVLSSANE
ncbi:MAG TPA: hypothetical protein VFP81_00970 [Propionibacteriaceae bacterium]|nr:hypothetical protein [Propionibacteriaceae bacterium]